MSFEKWKRYIVRGIIFCLARYPFWEGISTMMLFAEIENKFKSKINIPTYLVYADCGLLFTCGTFMSFFHGYRRNCAIIAAVHLALRSVVELNAHKLPQEFLIQVLLRNFGVLTCYLLVASNIGERKAKHTKTIQAIYFIFGFLFIFQSYLFATSDFQRNVIKFSLPHQVLSQLGTSVIFPFIVICTSLCSAMFLLMGKHLKVAKKFALIFYLLLVFPTDFQVFKWGKGMETWSCYRLIVSSFCACCSLVVLNLTEY